LIAPMQRRALADTIRTAWLLLAMIPVAVLSALFGLLTLVIASPLTIYASIMGKHLKDPRRKSPGLQGSS
jgi:hypothetical protein